MDQDERSAAGPRSYPPPGLPVSPSGQSRYPGRKPSTRRLSHWMVISGLIFLILFFATAVLSALSSHRSTLIPTKKVGVIEIKGIIAESKQTVEQFDEFLEDSNIATIVMRINSPGGLVAPTQEIYNKVLKVREKKPVIASVGTVAASGGYYIASAATTIIANPGSILGSIGVILKFVNYQDLQHWAKIKTTVIKSGEYKDMGSPTREMTAEERTLFQSAIDRLLGQFVKDVDRGREKLDEKAVRELADGRIFTGEDARDLGLVDDIGGFEDSIEFAAKTVGIKGKPKVVYAQHDKKKGLLELFFDGKALREGVALARSLLQSGLGDGAPDAFFSESIPLFYFVMN